MTGDSKEPTDLDSKAERHQTIRDAFLPFAKKFWKVNLNWRGNSLHFSDQQDDSSCGPCVINLLERLVDPKVKSWTLQKAASYRVSLFIQMAKYTLGQTVSLIIEIKFTIV